MGRGALLLLNVPPDKHGLIHDNDVAALKGFKAIPQKELGTNLAWKAKATATSFRGKSGQYKPGNLTDGNPETYWATDDNVSTGSVTVEIEIY